MLFGPKKVVGVDLGSSSVKIVELTRTRKGYHIESIGIAPIPKDSIVDGEILIYLLFLGYLGSLLLLLKLKELKHILVFLVQA